MKVIFVASGNKAVGQVSSFVRSQYESLEAQGLDMLLCPAIGHGWLSYAKTVLKLRRLVHNERPDVVHAHYSVCGLVAWLACVGLMHRPKIVVSILGSFPTRNRKWWLVRWAIQHLWDATLTKSKRTANQLGYDLPIVPNGVNLEVFHPMEDEPLCRAAKKARTVVWCSHPSRPEKNWALAEKVVTIVDEHLNADQCFKDIEKVELVAVYDRTPAEVAKAMNEADCLLLTSFREGSPNVVKEALACNCPVVSTNVGDVPERLEGLQGCYVAKSSDSADDELAVELAGYVEQVLYRNARVDGRERILADGLTVEQTAKKIIQIYERL